MLDVQRKIGERVLSCKKKRGRTLDVLWVSGPKFLQHKTEEGIFITRKQRKREGELEFEKALVRAIPINIA